MQKRAIETKNKILQTAIEEFSEKGFHGARIDEIAIKAGVNKQRIYAYYQSKDLLFSEVLKNCYEQIMVVEESLRNLKEKDIPILAKTILTQYVEFHEKHPEFWRLLTWENMSRGEHLHHLASFRSKSLDHIRELYRKGQALGHFKKDVPFDSFIYSLTAISYFMFSNYHTMKKIFGLELENKSFRQTLVEDCLKLMNLQQK